MAEQQKHVVLCGFMGSGKTTLGRLLAEKLQIGFLDIDDFIVEQAGLSVAEIFRRFGEEEFRELEHRAILTLCAGDSPSRVLATGGGALTFSRNVEPLRKGGTILYLNPGFEECYRRISSTDRPLVRSNTKAQLADLYNRRDILYRAAAHREIKMTGGTPGEWIQAMAQAVLR